MNEFTFTPYVPRCVACGTFAAPQDGMLCEECDSKAHADFFPFTWPALETRIEAELNWWDEWADQLIPS